MIGLPLIKNIFHEKCCVGSQKWQASDFGWLATHRHEIWLKEIVEKRVKAN